MFNFNINKSLDFKNNGGAEAEVAEEDVIEKPEDFSKVFDEAKVQFAEIAKELESGKKLSELKEINKKIPYYTFSRFSERNKHFISGNLLNQDDYAFQVEEYNRLITKIKDFDFATEKELKNTLKDAENLFNELKPAA